MQGNESFFDERQIIAEPSHSSSITWKSPWIKEKEEYERIRHRVRHFAPAMFKGKGKELFPQNTSEWIEHKRGIAATKEAGLRRDIAHVKEMIAIKEKNPRDQKFPKSFRGKVFDDGASSVLALPTVWTPINAHLRASWPSKRETQSYNDSRKTGPATQRNPLPPPRVPGTTLEQQAFMRLWPLDRTGPNHEGPSPDEIRFYNSLMDNDPDFEARGAILLGSALISELGERTEPTGLDKRYGSLQTVPEEGAMHYGCFDQEIVSDLAYAQPLNMPGQHGYAKQWQPPGDFLAGHHQETF